MSLANQPLRATHTSRSLTGTYALALAGNAVLLLLGWSWLYIPDSHTWQFVVAMLLAAAILAAFLALHVAIIRRLYPAPQRTSLQACLILLGWLVLGVGLQHLVAHLGSNIDTRAGYWNSQLSAHHRATFTYERLSHWQTLALAAVTWIVIPALVLPFAVETVQRTLRPWRAAAVTLARPELWLSIATAYIGGTCLGNRLIDWHPVHSVHGEVVSAIARTALVYCCAVALLVAVPLVIGLLLARSHERGDSLT